MTFELSFDNYWKMKIFSLIVLNIDVNVDVLQCKI